MRRPMTNLHFPAFMCILIRCGREAGKQHVFWWHASLVFGVISHRVGHNSANDQTQPKVSQRGQDSLPKRSPVSEDRQKAKMLTKKTKPFSTSGGDKLRRITTRWGVLPPCCNTIYRPIPSVETISREPLTSHKQGDSAGWVQEGAGVASVGWGGGGGG